MAVPRTKHADASRILGPWPLPGWLPDETLFSLASRYHLMSGHRLPEYTNQALFGGRRAGAHHDFPCPLTAFVECTEGRLGSVAEIAQDRTVLSYYLPHRDLVRHVSHNIGVTQAQILSVYCLVSLFIALSRTILAWNMIVLGQ